MNPADCVDGQGGHMGDIALHDPFEAIAQPDDVYLLESGADGRRPDDAVDARGGPATDEDGEIVVVVHTSMITESAVVSHGNPGGSRWCRARRWRVFAALARGKVCLELSRDTPA